MAKKSVSGEKLLSDKELDRLIDSSIKERNKRNKDKGVDLVASLVKEYEELSKPRRFLFEREITIPIKITVGYCWDGNIESSCPIDDVEIDIKTPERIPGISRTALRDLFESLDDWGYNCHEEILNHKDCKPFIDFSKRFDKFLAKIDDIRREYNTDIGIKELEAAKNAKNNR